MCRQAGWRFCQHCNAGKTGKGVEFTRGVFDAGDFFTGPYISSLTKGAAIIDAMNYPGLDAGDVARNHKKDIQLAKDVPGIDVMVTGHPHSGTPEAVISNSTIIVSTDAYTIELGKLELSYDTATDKITHYKNHLDYLYDDEVEDGPQMVKVINKWETKLSLITEEKVTTSTQALTRAYSEESLLGDMVADAMLHAYPDNDFAVTNSGGLRQGIDAGPVTVGELISSLSNGILQASKGVEMTYAESRPTGHCVVIASINGAPLDDNRTYKVLTSNFLADGGDGFLMFKSALTYKNIGVGIL